MLTTKEYAQMVIIQALHTPHARKHVRRANRDREPENVTAIVERLRMPLPGKV